MRWVLIAAGSNVQERLAACRLLKLPVQTQNGDSVLLTSASGAWILRQIAIIGRAGGAPIVELANARRCDETQFDKIMDSIHTVLALEPEFDVREMVLDLLKLGKPFAEE